MCGSPDGLTSGARHNNRYRVTVAGLLLALVTCFAPQLTAHASQPMQFERVGGDMGLSQGGVMTILQDRQGFLWLGTEDGLDRYDGYEVRRYIYDRNRPEGMPSNWVSTLAEDDSGTLWIGTDGGGLVGRNPSTDSFFTLQGANKEPVLTSPAILQIVRLDRRGRIWAGTRGSGLVMIDRKGEVHRYRHQDDDEATLSSDFVLDVYEDEKATVWVATRKGLDRLDPTTGTLVRQSAVGSRLASLPPGDTQVSVIAEDHKGRLWLGTKAGLLRFEPQAGTIAVYRNHSDDAASLPSDRVQAILEDSARRLWVGTAGGLALYDPHRDGFDVYRHDPADSSTLPDDNVISLYEDHSGLLWVGTKTGGVARWNPRSWSFGRHIGALEGFADANPTAFAEDDTGTLWVGTLGGGLHAIDRRHDTIRHYRHTAGDAESLPDDHVMALLLDHEGTLWIGTMSAGLASLDRRTGQFTPYPYGAADSGSLGAPGVMSLLEDATGRIWVGTFGGGLAVLDRVTHTFKRFNSNPADQTTLSSDRVTALAEDSSGRIWVGTDGGGLCLLDPATGRMTRFARDAARASALSASTVYAIRTDEHGRVWIGTRGGGLDQVQGSALSPSTVTFKHYTESSGLPDSTIYGIESDSTGKLWLSTNRGLSRFDPGTHEVRNFRRAHGLQGDEFNFGAHYRSGEGELFFGGPGGYNAFFADRLQFNDRQPAVVLTSLLMLNEPARIATPPEWLQRLELGYRDKIVTLEFAALDFASPQDNRYYYMLEGFDTTWVNAGSRRSVTYTNLNAGSYVFRVRAENSDGKSNDTGLTLPITVKPAPWATLWARAAYGAVLLMLIFAAWNHQQEKLRREARYAQRLQQEVHDRTAELGLRNEELERANKQLREASITDPLTGLGNRRFLREVMGTLMTPEPTGAGASPGHILMVVDLDHLKPINDQHGHEAGDRILLQVTEILRRCSRASDSVVRWGGDEFVILYQDTDLAAAEVLAERIRSRVAKQIFRVADGKAVRASCSIGFSRWPFVPVAPTTLTWEQCLAAADAALYQAKKLRNGWVGLAGTAAALDVPSLLKTLELDPETLEREGRLDVRRPRFRPEDTVNTLALDGRRRDDG